MILTVVVVAGPRGTAYTFTAIGLGRAQPHPVVFVTVPQGAKALQVNLGGLAAGSQTRFIAINPYGVPVERPRTLVLLHQLRDRQPATATLACATRTRCPASGRSRSRRGARRRCSTTRTRIARRGPGRGRRPGVARRSPSATAGTAGAGLLDGDEQLRPGHGTPSGRCRSAAPRRRRPTIANHEVQEYHGRRCRRAPRAWTARIGKPSDPGADLDLFVYNAAGAVVAQSADGDSEEAVTIANPAAGTYTVAGRRVRGPGGTTAYDYLDVFFSPALGSLTVPATAFDLAPGASAPVSGPAHGERGTRCRSSALR